jgi:cysteine-rich repeat protein
MSRPRELLGTCIAGLFACSSPVDLVVPPSEGSSSTSTGSTTGDDDPDAGAEPHAEADHDSSGGTTSTGGMSGSTADDATTTGSASTGIEGFCGDGIINNGEECDNYLAGNDDSAACLSSCKHAKCGDGHIHLGKEECDDENADPLDGCHDCGRTRKVFITSEIYQGAQFMGLWGADQRCGSLAAQAGLPNFAGYKAWLSDSTTAARDRLYPGKGRYELVNGLLVADSWAALLAGELQHPINVTQLSETLETVVFTGTAPNGTILEGSDHCADWTSQNLGNTAFVGASSEISAYWTFIDDEYNPSDCGGASALYCFEQE